MYTFRQTMSKIFKDRNSNELKGSVWRKILCWDYIIKKISIFV